MNRLSVQTGGWYEELFHGDENAEAAFRFIKNCGFDAVDYNLDVKHTIPKIRACERNPLFEKPREEILRHYQSVKEGAEKAGIVFGQAHAPLLLHVEGNEAYNKYLVSVVIELLYVCAYISCPALVVHPIKNPDKEREWVLNMELFSQLIPAARETGVKVCLENLNERRGDHAIGGVCSTGEEACRYIDTLNAMAEAELFGFCLDIGHANMAGQSIRRMINKLAGRLCILHLHDNDGIWDRHQIPYTYRNSAATESSVDWEGLLGGLRDIGYKGTLNFETFAALAIIPQALYEPTLKYINAIGRYFQSRLG